MVENDHPFVVNFIVYKINTLIFRTREEAENAKERLAAGEDYVALVDEYKQTKFLAVDAAKKWQRYGSSFMYYKIINKPLPELNKGEIKGPIVMLGGVSFSELGLGYVGWNVFQVTDMRLVPVALMDDDYSGIYMSTQSIIRQVLEYEQESDLRKKLWASATVTVDGVDVPTHSGRVDFVGCSQ